MTVKTTPARDRDELPRGEICLQTSLVYLSSCALHHYVLAVVGDCECPEKISMAPARCFRVVDLRLNIYFTFILISRLTMGTLKGDFHPPDGRGLDRMALFDR